MNKGEYKNAKDYFDKSHAIYSLQVTEHHPMQEAKLYESMALLFQKMGNHQSASIT